MKHIQGSHPPTQLVWVSEYKELQEDNQRLSDRCALLDHAIRSIAEAAGMTEAFTGVDVDPECGVLVERVKGLRAVILSKRKNDLP